MRAVSKNRQLVIDALFCALIIIFTFVPYLGYYTIGVISFQIIHVFVILGAFLFGLKRAILYSAVFGLMSLLKVFTIPAGWFDALFIYPWNSVLPRVLFGVICGVVFEILKKRLTFKNYLIAGAIAGFLLTLVHTLLVLTCVYIFNYNDIVLNNGGDFASYVSVVLLSLVGTGTLLEAICGAVLTPLLGGILFKFAIPYTGKQVKVIKNPATPANFRRIFKEELYDAWSRK